MYIKTERLYFHNQINIGHKHNSQFVLYTNFSCKKITLKYCNVIYHHYFYLQILPFIRSFKIGVKFSSLIVGLILSHNL